MVLPQPSDDFVWVQAEAGPGLVCRALPSNVRHLFTTRTWRLGSNRGTGDEAWGEIAAAMDVNQHDLARMHQVHGANVFEATRLAGIDRPEADIAVTSESGIAITIQTADCIPLLLVDRRRRAVAAAHAGWRGLAQRVPEVAVRAMAQRFGSAPSDLIAAIGPSIGACCYEVGADVRDVFVAAAFGGEALARWFFDAPQPTPQNPSMPTLSPTRRPDRWFLDCWAVARDQLTSAGVHAIHVAGLCSASHPALLCSYRRDGRAAGRMAAAIRSAADLRSRPS
jgi:purine-nucleoside/S-methyl-5'-thioadenosine phosphorylase / adenosine deaminase